MVAASNHAKTFVGSVEVISTRELVKERFVEVNRYRKLFETYSGKKDFDVIWPDLMDFDAVIVTDYGHGMMTPEIVGKLCRESRYLAVNVQTNAGNYGFNLAAKYPHVDYLCVDETEARLATQNQHGDIESSVIQLGRIADKVAVTLGKNGAIGSGLTRSEALSNGVVDTMGAGDAFFSITACIAEETPMPDLLKIGNAAGALKAQSLGQRSVTKDELLTYLSR